LISQPFHCTVLSSFCAHHPPHVLPYFFHHQSRPNSCVGQLHLSSALCGEGGGFPLSYWDAGGGTNVHSLIYSTLGPFAGYYEVLQLQICLRSQLRLFLAEETSCAAFLNLIQNVKSA
jgi:hypothetical protein